MQTSEQSYEETNVPHAAWCINCDGPVDIDEHGRCITCCEEGSDCGTDDVVLEPLGPRAIVCPRCDAAVGEVCALDDEGRGWNHAERVEEATDAEPESNVIEVDFERASRRSRGRR